MNNILKRIIKKCFLKIGFQVVRKKSSIEKEILLDYDILKGISKPPFDKVPFAAETLQVLVNNFEFKTVLDVGSGEGKHSDVFKECGKNVTSIDFGKSVYFEQREDNHTCIFGDYYTYNFSEKFDAIWASHVLEHQPNPNLFLKGNKTKSLSNLLKPYTNIKIIYIKQTNDILKNNAIQLSPGK